MGKTSANTDGVESLHDRLALLMSSLGVGVLSEDSRGRTLFVNDWIRTFFGLEKTEKLLGKPSLLLDPRVAILEHRVEAVKEKILSLRQKAVSAIERLDLRDGRAIERTYVPVVLNGKDEGQIWIYRDVTREFRTSDGVNAPGLYEISPLIAEEISNPLEVMDFTLDLVKYRFTTQSLSPQILQHCLRRLTALISRTSQVVKGLQTMNYARVTSEPLERVSLKETIESALLLCQSKIQARQIQVKLDLPNPALKLKCRGRLILQTLVSVLDNACDAVENLEERWISIGVFSEADRVRITIADSGKGIPAQNEKRIFKPFFTTKDPSKGIGLGLSLAQTIVESHGGTLELDHETKPTTFVITLPLQLDEQEGNQK